MPRALIGLGSNLGDRHRWLDEAVAALGRIPGSRVVARSRDYDTSPVGGPPDQPPYLNGCAIVETPLPPEALLNALQTIEAELGRERLVAWGPRTVDLDLLLYDEAVLRSDRLQVPHRRLAFRKFALTPAAEIAGAWRHPLLEQPLSELARQLATGPHYVAFVGHTSGFRTQFAAEAADAARARLVDATPASVPASVEELVSHGPTRAAAIEFLRARTHAILAGLAEAESGWVVDDAWPAAEATALAAALGLDPTELIADLVLPEPTLLVCLRAPGDAVHAAAREVRGVGPVVGLPAVVDVDVADREGALTEIAAALDAAGGHATEPSVADR